MSRSGRSPDWVKMKNPAAPAAKREAEEKLQGHEMRKLSLRHFNGHFLVTGPDTEPAKFKTRQQALNWCAAHYPDLPIKEHRPGGKRLAANKPASSGDEQ